MAWPGNADPPQCECEYHSWAIGTLVFCFPLLIGGFFATIISIMHREVELAKKFAFGGMAPLVFIGLITLSIGKKKLCSTCKGE